jgi:hypothetical protein
MDNSRVQRLKIMIENADFLIEDLGSAYSDMRKECISECSKLMDTHELTIAEQNCARNCFKKFGYAYHNFSNLIHNSSPVLRQWDEFKVKNPLDPNSKDTINPLI